MFFEEHFSSLGPYSIVNKSLVIGFFSSSPDCQENLCIK